MANQGLTLFYKTTRATLAYAPPTVRVVWKSEFASQAATNHLHAYIADKAPSLYRDPRAFTKTLRDDLYVSAFKETLQRLPDSQSFKESHFGEIIACLFAEEVLNYRRLYSKLSLLTAQNANAYKMDLVTSFRTQIP